MKNKIFVVLGISSLFFYVIHSFFYVFSTYELEMIFHTVYRN